MSQSDASEKYCPTTAAKADLGRATLKLSKTHPDASRLLERAGLCHPPALRCGDGGGDIPPGDDAARARAQSVEGGLCPALAPPDRRTLWRESEPAAALLPVSGDIEAEPPGPAATVPR